MKRRTAGGAAPQARAAANRVRIGLIGLGLQGVRLARLLASVPGAELAGVADLYDGRGRRARELAGGGVTIVRDGRRLLERSDIDAVIVATPDHWHAPLVADAVSAGKDVYVECPVTQSAVDDELIAQRVEGRDRIVQCGGGWVSSPTFAAARRLIREGRLGRVTLVRATWDSGAALEAWQIPYPPDASPESIDFATFLGPAPPRPFDLSRFFRWRCYTDYGSGLAGARLAPQLTAIHWLLDLEAPARMAASGGVHRWKDGREVPDVLHATLEYPAGVTVVLAASQNGGSRRALHVAGTDATLAIDDEGLTLADEADAEPYAAVGDSWSKEYRDWFYMMHGMSPQGVVRGAPPAERALERYAQQDGATTAAAHLADFVECVRSRRAPLEPLALGRRVARIVREIAQAVPASGAEAR